LILAGISRSIRVVLAGLAGISRGTSSTSVVYQPGINPNTQVTSTQGAKAKATPHLPIL